MTLPSEEDLEKRTADHSKPNLLENKIFHSEEQKDRENIRNVVDHISINSTKENGSSSHGALIAVNTETDLLKEVQNISIDPIKRKTRAENGKTSIVGKNEHLNMPQADEVLEVSAFLLS